MRIIRTEMYFDDVGLKLHRPVGISTAWVAGDFDIDFFPSAIRDKWPSRAKSLITRPFSRIEMNRLPEELTNVIASSFRGLRISVSTRDYPEIERVIDRHVSAVLREPIVIERSPPTHIRLEDLVRAAKDKSPLVLGAVVGYATGEGPLLLVTVPLGMLVVSSAAGLSRALDEGLYDLLKAWLKKP